MKGVFAMSMGVRGFQWQEGASGLPAVAPQGRAAGGPGHAPRLRITWHNWSPFLKL